MPEHQKAPDVQYFLEFNAQKDNLTDNERMTLATIEKAGRTIAQLYAKQENPQFDGNNLYPLDITREEFHAKTAEGKQLGSPYTVVVRNADGELEAIPYCQYYKDALGKIHDVLIEAAKKTDDPNLRVVLNARAQSCLDDSWQQSEIVWLKTPASRINLVIGPIENYLDNLAGVKTAYDMYVGIIDDQATADAVRLKNAALALIPNPPIVDVRIMHTTMAAGMLARARFAATNLPNNPSVMDEHGSIITLNLPIFEKNFVTNHLPNVRNVFAPSLEEKLSDEALRTADMRRIFMHEVAHSLVRYPGQEERLKHHYSVINELYATIEGERILATIPNEITDEELANVYLMHVNRTLVLIKEVQTDPTKRSYAQGEAIALNYLIQKGAITLGDTAVTNVDFATFKEGVSEIAAMLQAIAEHGTTTDVDALITQYGDYAPFTKVTAA